MPAEWEPHAATWIGWPHNKSDWPGKFAPIPWVYGEIARKVAPGELVRILVNSAAHEAQARRLLTKCGVDLEKLDGQGAGIEFWGHSFVADPFGVVVAEAPADKEALLIAEVDFARVEEVRRNWPFLRDRRTDAYGGIERRFLTD